MTPPGLERNFVAAAGHEPFDYQPRPDNGESGGDSGKPCQTQLINIPAGFGKTAAVALGWLWNRFEIQNLDWVMYCLPTRSLAIHLNQRRICAEEVPWTN